jgi:hypothetical protein
MYLQAAYVQITKHLQLKDFQKKEKQIFLHHNA